MYLRDFVSLVITQGYSVILHGSLPMRSPRFSRVTPQLQDVYQATGKRKRTKNQLEDSLQVISERKQTESCPTGWL
jgi:hypothetical protein